MTLKQSKLAGTPSQKMEYSSKNQLVKVQFIPDILSPGVSKEIFYTYDVMGRRLEKKIIDYTQNPSTIKSRRYLYDGDNILAEFDGGNQLLATYTLSPLTPDDVLSSRVTAIGVSAGIAPTVGTIYFLKDMLGSVTDLISATGDILQRFEYSAFGKILSIKDGTGADVTANAPYRPQFSFTGRELDEETGLYYYRARYYDASTGRFLQRDPVSGSGADPITAINKYTYAKNNPSVYKDPTGKWSFFGINFGTYQLASFVSGMFRPIYDIIRANISDIDRGRLDNAVIATGAGVLAASIAPVTAGVAAGTTAYQNRNNGGGNFFDNLEGYTNDFGTNFAVSYAFNYAWDYALSGSVFTDLDPSKSAGIASFFGASVDQGSFSLFSGLTGVAAKEYLCSNYHQIPSGLGGDIARSLASNRENQRCD